MSTPPKPEPIDYFASGVATHADGGFYPTIDFGEGRLYVGPRATTVEDAHKAMFDMVERVREEFAKSGVYVKNLGNTQPGTGKAN